MKSKILQRRLMKRKRGTIQVDSPPSVQPGPSEESRAMQP
jgi:hypothetical protein